MENNRTLLISIAGTRKTKHWPRTELTWAEFVEKLKTPVRSTESLDEYLNYAKVKQDELKDVGCLLYTSPSPRDGATSRMPSSA